VRFTLIGVHVGSELENCRHSEITGHNQPATTNETIHSNNPTNQTRTPTIH
jgi:hypothetical protein